MATDLGIVVAKTQKALPFLLFFLPWLFLMNEGLPLMHWPCLSLQSLQELGDHILQASGQKHQKLA